MTWVLNGVAHCIVTPSQVSLLGPVSVVPEPQRLPALVEQFEFGIRNENLGGRPLPFGKTASP